MTPTPSHSLDAAALQAAARVLDARWRAGEHGPDLPDDQRPRERAQGYAVQAAWIAARGQRVAGWKIAATSEAGQKHIAVSGPLAGPVFADRLHADGDAVSLAGNAMRVAECEIVFRFGRTLLPQSGPRTLDEVLAALDAVLPGIEVPDSRFAAFELAGEAQLMADGACCRDMVLGTPLAPDARLHQLRELAVQAEVSDGRRPAGIGRNVLGDPLVALRWLVNELGSAGQTLQAGQFVTTGACVVPIAVQPGDRVQADFGWLGRIGARFV